MPVLLRALVSAAWFALAGPLVGIGLALALGVFGSGETHWATVPGDASYSILEFGLPAAVAGAVFAIFSYFARRQSTVVPIWFKGSAGAAAMLVVFGIPFVQKLLVYGHVSRIWALIGIFAAVAGAIIGSSFPSRWLLPKENNAG